MIKPPLQAAAIIAAVCYEEGEVPSRIRNPRNVTTLREHAVRRRIWIMLYGQAEDGRHMFSQAEIASWFGVTSSAVCAALKVGGGRGVTNTKRASRRRPPCVEVTPS